MCPRGGRSDWKEIIAVQLNYAGVTLFDVIMGGGVRMCTGAILQRYVHHRLTKDTASDRSLVHTDERNIFSG